MGLGIEVQQIAGIRVAIRVAVGHIEGQHEFMRRVSAAVSLMGFALRGDLRPAFQAGLQRVLRQVEGRIVQRSDAAQGVLVPPKRGSVERSIAWLNRMALAFPRLAPIRLMPRQRWHPC